METIKISKVPKILDLHFDVNEPVLLLGPPGIGKSEVVNEFAKNKAKQLNKTFVNWHDISEEGRGSVIRQPNKFFTLIDLRLYEYDPSEIKGLLYIDEVNRKTELFPWEWMKIFYFPTANGLIFLDELNMAHPEVMKIAFKILNDRIIGDRRIKGNVLIVGAGNPVKFNYLVNDLPLPLVDRLAIYYVETDIYEWFKWAIPKGVNDKVIRFLTIYPQYLLYTKQISELYTHKILSPRTWYKISKILNKLEEQIKSNTQLIDEASIALAGYLHPEVYNKFMSFYRMQVLQQFDKIISTTTDFEKIADNLEYAIVYIDHIAGKFVAGSLDLQQLKNVIAKVMKIRFEFAVYLIITIITLLRMNKNEKTLAKYEELLDMLRNDFPDLFVTIAQLSLENF